MTAAPLPPIVALRLDAGAAARPAALAEAAARAEAAGVDLLVLDGDKLHPLILAAWLIPQLKRAGVVAATPTLTGYPFHVARALSAVDILSQGRAGWAPQAMSHDAGDLAKAVDFIDATVSLWDGWEPDALVIDQAAGIYLDPAKVRRMNYRGPYFQVMGPLNAARPAQGHPILLQSDADPLWLKTIGRADLLVCGRPDRATLDDRRARLAAAGGHARLLARLDLAGASAADVGGWVAEGLVEGVFLAPSDPAALGALLDALSLAAPGRAAAPLRGDLRARFALPTPPARALEPAWP